jgi:DNA-directed RNA polymerase
MVQEALQNADLSTVYDGLNALGRVPWQINKKILEVANHCWENNISLGDIPPRTDYDVPQQPIRPERPSVKLEKDAPGYKESVAEYRAYREAFSKFRRLQQKNMVRCDDCWTDSMFATTRRHESSPRLIRSLIQDLRSLRCSAMLKLDQAEKFQNFEEIFFPYNMDFRGRAYPVPPHLSNVGSDLCRGMLKFAEAKPLGPRGLYWLKVHLANFAGKDKMSFEDRAKFVDDHIDEVLASAADPFAGDCWWKSLEDPFQGLATCIEISNAIASGDPESHMCSLPVHMDGSCNGLQHYAALGRDLVGGKAVNLCSMDGPQDVYVGVMHEVIRRVAEEADRQVDFDTSDIESLSRKQKKEYKNNRAAKLVNGLIDRGVVKRTVMTSVYGVTYIGARQQIQEKIESKLEAQGQDIDEISSDIFNACGYLARVTMDVMGDLFAGAKDTMKWLTTCAKMISQHGYPVAWISPIGIPAIQPYREKRSATLVTLLQTVTLVDRSDDLPIHKQRQCSAFPPNYIHSLDSSHMLLTALEMDRRGLTFSAVHDSFWTHPCNIDEMNGALRDVFVELYDQPLLERLLETWQMRYPDLDFPELPKRGELELKEVKEAIYFFQ